MLNSRPVYSVWLLSFFLFLCAATLCAQTRPQVLEVSTLYDGCADLSLPHGRTDTKFDSVSVFFQFAVWPTPHFFVPST
jgi:hypothetical protein